MMYLELMWLQFAISGFGSQGGYIGADGCQSFGVGVKYYGRDQAVGCTHCYAHVHHMISEKKKKKVSTAQRSRQEDLSVV